MRAQKRGPWRIAKMSVVGGVASNTVEIWVDHWLTIDKRGAIVLAVIFGVGSPERRLNRGIDRRDTCKRLDWETSWSWYNTDTDMSTLYFILWKIYRWTSSNNMDHMHLKANTWYSNQEHTAVAKCSVQIWMISIRSDSTCQMPSDSLTHLIHFIKRYPVARKAKKSHDKCTNSNPKMLDKKQGTSEQGQPMFPLVSSSFLLEGTLGTGKHRASEFLYTSCI